MNARINHLVYELGGLRLQQRRDPRPDLAARIAVIEAELERANYQFHAADPRG